MNTVLLTGASGFIGRYLFKKLQNDGYHVVGTSAKTADANLICCDLTNKEAVLKLLQDVKPQIVIHAAALSSVTSGTTLEYYQSNVVATENLFTSVDTISSKCRIIFLSTAGVYGAQDADCLSEDFCPKPVSHYGYSKYVCERILFTYKDKYDITILRPFNVIGHGQSPSFIVPKLVRHFAEKKSEIVLGNVLPERDYISVEECCEIISSLIDNEKSFGEIVNICSGQPMSVAKMIDLLVEISGYEITVKSSAEFIRKNEIMKLIGSVKKLDLLLPNRMKPKEIKDVLKEMLEKHTPA